MIRQEIIFDHLKKLVEIPSITGDQQAIKEALDYIEDCIKEYPEFKIKRHAVNGVEFLVASTKNLKQPKVLLAAHLDVVYAEPSQFFLTQKNDNYYGRGAFDMKFAIASYLAIIEELKDELKNIDVGIMITSDEEIGGANGVAALIRQGYLPSVCILPDGADSDNWTIETFAKGLRFVELNAEGISAHGSRPWQGENAIEKIINSLNEIRALFPENKPETATMNIGTIGGGRVINQVAEVASASFEYRTTSNEEGQQIDKQVKDICQKHDVHIEFIVDQTIGSVANNSIGDPLINSFVNELENITGTKTEIVRSLGSTDARFFTPHNVPCVVVSPPGGGHHGKDEWISITGINQFSEAIKNYIQKEAITSE